MWPHPWPRNLEPGRRSYSPSESGDRAIIRKGLNKMRHRVMYSNSSDPNSYDQRFRLHEDAIEFAENILKQHRFVWLSEYGIYRNRGRRRLTSWIYYWWSPAVAKTEWG